MSVKIERACVNVIMANGTMLCQAEANQRLELDA